MGWPPSPSRARLTGSLSAGLLIAAVVGGAGGRAGALEPARVVTRHDVRTYGAEEELPQTTVTSLAQTPDGYLWVGTEGGLARFDGRRFRVFRSEDTPALRIHRVRALRVDRAGALWIGTEGGAGLVRFRDGRFDTFEERLGRGGAAHRIYEDRAGAIWFSNAGGLVRFDGEQALRLAERDGVTLTDGLAMAEDGVGDLWVGTLHGLACVPRSADAAARAFGELGGVSTAPARAIVSDGAGGLWFAVGEGALAHLPGERAGCASAQLTVAWPPDPALGYLHALLRDGHGTLWAASDGGLARLGDGGWQRMSERLSVPAMALLEDREANLWVGAQIDGLLRVTHGPFQSLPGAASSGRRIAALVAGRGAGGGAGGALWIGSEGGGLVRQQGGQLAPVSLGAQCTDRIWAMAEDGAGGLWFGGERGARASLCRLDLATGHVTTFRERDGFPDLAVRALWADADGSLLVGSHDGLYRARGARVELAYRDGPSAFDVYAVRRDARGELWLGVGGAAGGLHHHDGARWTRIVAGLSNPLVFSVEPGPDGSLWLGTLSGLSRHRAGVVTGWRHAEGLFNDPVWQALPDGDGNLWLCAPHGVFRVDRDSLARFDRTGAPIEPVRFGAADGLAADQCEGGRGQHAALRDAAGVLWFGSGGAVAFLDPVGFRQRRSDVPPIIEEVVIDGRRAAAVAPLGHLALPPGRGDLEIAFTAPWLAQPQRVRLRYRLAPFEPDWVDARERRRAYYTRVPPGSYRFEVERTDAAAPAPLAASLELSLAPAVHQTWWFRALAVGLAAALSWGAVLAWHRRNLRALDAQHRAILTERTRIARDLHDTLAQGFTGISVQLEAAQAWLPDLPPRARESLDKARALVRASLSDARRAVWALVPQAAEAGDLPRALAELGRSLSAEVAVRVQVDGAPRSLPAGQTEVIVRVAQEALTNAIRHARARSVALVLSYARDGVRLTVSDDGRGFDPARAAVRDPSESGGLHLGLSGMRARAAQAGGQITIESRPGAGTRIDLWIAAATSPEAVRRDEANKPARSHSP